MGLDMYLHVKEYVSRWDYSDGYENKKEHETFKNLIDATPNAREFIAPDCVGTEVSYTAMYWRKANAIHSWFVTNVQDGIDECQEHYVSTETLKELVAKCADILLHKDDHDYCREVLTPAAGFFFGSTDIDEWYFEDIQRTYDRLSVLLAKADESEKNGKYVQFAYQSSW